MTRSRSGSSGQGTVPGILLLVASPGDDQQPAAGARPAGREGETARCRGCRRAPEGMAAARVLVDSGLLQPSQTATTLRVRDGETLLSDGPFAEIKEQLGGYYILECEDLDVALRYAAMIPSAKYGSVEVR